MHVFTNLQYLSLCKCNIGDETILLLLNTDPFKLNVINEDNGNVRSPDNKGKFLTPNRKKKKEEENKEKLVSGLVKTLKSLNVSKNRI